MGTPDFAVRALASIAESNHQVIAVYTQPPRPSGRGHAERPSPVHQKADALGVPVYTPERLRDAEAQAEAVA